MKIVVLDGETVNPGDNSWDSIAQFGELVVYPRTAREQLIERAHDADILLTNKTPIRAADLLALPRLKFVAVLATGFNVVDVAAARDRHIAVANVPSYCSETVAQHVFALILELANRVGDHSASVHQGDWERCADFSYWKHPVSELAGSSLGIVGLGKIGKGVAQLGHAFGMQILRMGPEGASASRDTFPGEGQLGGLQIPYLTLPRDEFFRAADVVTLHCPLAPATAGLINRHTLRLMRRTAWVINTARGGLVEEADLARSLNSGEVAGAALDVLSVEPPSSENPLLTAANCLITPHLAWSSLPARRRLVKVTSENIRAFLGGNPANVVNLN